MDPLKMYFLLKMGIFHCYVGLPEGDMYNNHQNKKHKTGFLEHFRIP